MFFLLYLEKIKNMSQKNILNDIDKLLMQVNFPARFILLEELNQINPSIQSIKPKALDVKYYTEFKEMLLSFGYIEHIQTGFFKFTSKGYEARSMGGHFVYQKSLTPKMTKFEKWSLLISILALLIAIIPYIINQIEISELKSRLETLEKET